MTVFAQACGLVLLALILILALSGHSRDMAALLALAACCMVAMVALRYLEPVLTFLEQLEALAGLDGDMVKILLKAVGIGMIAEIAGLVCADAGNASLGKTVQLLGSVVILYLTVPLFTSLINLMQQILGEL